MTWVIVAVVVIAALAFLFSPSKKPAVTEKFVSSGNSTEDSHRLLEGLVQENRTRWARLPDETVNELIEAMRRDVETFWEHGYGSATRDGKDTAFATHVGLLRIASFLITGEQKNHEAFSEGLVLEMVPFKSLPPEQAKSTAVEYCISKYHPSKADFGILIPALLQFADETFEAAKTKSDPDGYVYEMIYRETLDWQKILSEALSKRNKANG